MLFASVMLLALGLEGLLGWPDALFNRIGHPVTWMGSLIAACDQRFNRDRATEMQRRLAGVGVVLALCAGVWLVTSALVWLLPGGWIGVLLTAVLAWPLLAARSLYDHVRAVALPLASNDLAGARRAVAKIVVLYRERLDAAGVSRDRRHWKAWRKAPALRRGGALVLGGDPGPAGACGLQDDQHDGFYDRPS